jgi:hypothetical protein
MIYAATEMVTTLDVKNRAKGYYAVQKEVAKLVRELASENSWKSYKKDNHSVYLITNNGVVA